MAKQIAEEVGEKIYYMCNPEINKDCNKRFCKYNTNAIDNICDKTSKKKFALKMERKQR